MEALVFIRVIPYHIIWVIITIFPSNFQFQDILKPAYNTVDMIEVELTDDDRGPRDFNPALLHVSAILLWALNRLIVWNLCVFKDTRIYNKSVHRSKVGAREVSFRRNGEQILLIFLWFCCTEIVFSQKRVSRTRRQYYWTPIKNTPFTLVVTYPETYGVNRLQIRTEDEIHRIHAKSGNVASFFTGINWRIHPDWCVSAYLRAFRRY